MGHEYRGTYQTRREKAPERASLDALHLQPAQVKFQNFTITENTINNINSVGTSFMIL